MKLSLLSKSAFLTKLAISLLPAKFDCLNLVVKFSDVNPLNSGVVIYLSWLWSVIFFSISSSVVLYSVFLTKLLTLGNSFSAAVREVVVVKLVMSGISPWTSFILALRAVLVAKLVI